MWLGHGQATPSARGDLYPDIANASHASRRTTEIFQDYFTAKSLHNVNLWLQFFHPTQVVYYNTTLGVGWPSRSTIMVPFTSMVQA
jgi:hypothetical protein